MDTLGSGHMAEHEAETLLASLARRGESIESFGRQPAKMMQGIHTEITALVERRVSMDFITSVLVAAGISCGKEALRRYLIKHMPDEYAEIYARKRVARSQVLEGGTMTRSPASDNRSEGQGAIAEKSRKTSTTRPATNSGPNDIQRKYSNRDINHESRHHKANPADFFGSDGADGFNFLKRSEDRGNK